MMQTIRQAFTILRQNPLLSTISILGTAFAITMIMAIVITWQTKYADLEPEVRQNFVDIAYKKSKRLEKLIEDLFEKLSRSILEMTMQLSYQYDITNFIYAGGVSCSQYMRNFLVEHM